MHYPDTISNIGPLVHVSCMRFEARHKELKKNAINVQSRKNLPLTLAKKNQLQFLYRCMSKIGLSNRIKTSKILHMHPKCSMLDLNDYYEICWFEINGTRFKKSNVIFFDIQENIPQLYKIIRIFHNFADISDCIFLCQECICVQYISHYDAYIVQDGDEKVLFSLSDIETCIPLNIHTLQDGNKYINIINK